jgi:hypothetical protein
MRQPQSPNTASPIDCRQIKMTNSAKTIPFVAVVWRWLSLSIATFDPARCGFVPNDATQAGDRAEPSGPRTNLTY